ncbi:MAG: primosomal protein N' [Candidatus Omnitrophota bacterium]|jgi:primosomal protein N' (replication factor Y)
MLYAKIVLGLPVEGPFDYSVPEKFTPKIKAGMRARVSFGTRKMTGYIVGVTKKTGIKNIKPLSEIIDRSPVLDKHMLLLTKRISGYYCCSWGEAIETALPEQLRIGRIMPETGETLNKPGKSNPEVILIHDLKGNERWNTYFDNIKEALKNNKQTIVLLPDKKNVLRVKQAMEDKFNCPIGVLFRKEPRELDEWVKIKEGKFNIVLATRSGIFAPLKDLGLVIIDDEQDSVYKQDQVPHYHAREAAFMRINIEKAKLVLGSSAPSLESFYLAKKAKIKYNFIPGTDGFPEIKIIDTRHLALQARRKNIFFSKYLEDAIISCLNSKGKILLFLNRRGFATFASCRHCGITLKCPRCNINLVYHFGENILNCHYCNFKMPAPEICPNCNSGYIRYSGTGTEKIESELTRIFPGARIKRWESSCTLDIQEADIFIATQAIIKEADYRFDLIAVLSIDNSLNRVDFRSAEKTFQMLAGLLGLAQRQLIVQTNSPKHHCFRALESNNIGLFYEEELKERRQLNFPPYQHLGIVKLRSKNEPRVKQAANQLFAKLNKDNHKNKALKIISLNPAQPAKLRGNFYWQILIRAKSPQELAGFLKINLKNFPHSGIIVTVDIDPI